MFRSLLYIAQRDQEGSALISQTSRKLGCDYLLHNIIGWPISVFLSREYKRANCMERETRKRNPVYRFVTISRSRILGLRGLRINVKFRPREPPRAIREKYLPRDVRTKFAHISRSM